MLINIKNGIDLITLDLRINQIRYLHDIEERGLIEFIEMGHTDSECYEYLFKEDRQLFFESLKEDVFNFLGIEIKNEMVVV